MSCVGLKVTVTPAGMPLADKVGEASCGPEEIAAVIVEVPLLPCATDTVEGAAEREKFVTHSPTLAVPVTPPPVPVTVNGALQPPVAEVVAVIVIVVVPEPGAAMGLGLKTTLTPEGKLLAEKVIGALKPLEMVLVTCQVILLPAHTSGLAGGVDKVKPPPGVTVSNTVIECAMLSPVAVPVPVTVIG